MTHEGLWMSYTLERILTVSGQRPQMEEHQYMPPNCTCKGFKTLLNKLNMTQLTQQTQKALFLKMKISRVCV